MRILWLNANLLLPLDKGGKIRTWHLMRHLARRHQITYLTFASDAETQAHRPAMREVCSELVNVPWQDAPKGSLRFYGGVAAHLVDPLPYAVAKYRSAIYRHSLEALLDHGGFDRLVCDFLVPAVNLRRTPRCPSILFTHNVEAEIWRRHAENASGRVARALYRQQWRRMLRFEGRTLSRFDRVLAVSDADDQTFRRLYGAGLPPIDVVATGVDTTFFTPTPESFCDSTVVGMRMWRMPRCAVAATSPTASSTAPPPMAIT
jgi:glycosyltransferase involved in cell wall biosynthesis